MTEHESLQRLTRITRGVRVSPLRKRFFTVLLVVSIAAAGYAGYSLWRGAEDSLFTLDITLLAAAISALVLITGYAQRRF